MIVFRHLEKVLEEFGNAMAEQYKNNLSNSDRVATGNLLNSIKRIIEVNGNLYEINFELNDYFKYIEEGTGPRHLPDARASYFVPYKPILDWVYAKNITATYPDKNGRLPTQEQLAYAIKTSIGRNGIKPKQDLKNAIETTDQGWEERIEEAIDQDIDECFDELLTIFQ